MDFSYKRDETFVNKMIYDANKAVIVTGGFHTRNFLNKLKEKDISYISIIPNFKCVEDSSKYFSLLSGNMNTNLVGFIQSGGFSLALYSYLSTNDGSVYIADTLKAFDTSVKVISELLDKGQSVLDLDNGKRFNFSFDSKYGQIINGVIVDNRQVYVSEISEHTKYHQDGNFAEVISMIANEIGAEFDQETGLYKIKEKLIESNNKIRTSTGELYYIAEDNILVIVDSRFNKDHAGRGRQCVYVRQRENSKLTKAKIKHEITELKEWTKWATAKDLLTDNDVVNGLLGESLIAYFNDPAKKDEMVFLKEAFHKKGLAAEEEFLKEEVSEQIQKFIEKELFDYFEYQNSIEDPQSEEDAIADKEKELINKAKEINAEFSNYLEDILQFAFLYVDPQDKIEMLQMLKEEAIDKDIQEAIKNGQEESVARDIAQKVDREQFLQMRLDIIIRVNMMEIIENVNKKVSEFNSLFLNKKEIGIFFQSVYKGDRLVLLPHVIKLRKQYSASNNRTITMVYLDDSLKIRGEKLSVKGFADSNLDLVAVVQPNVDKTVNDVEEALNGGQYYNTEKDKKNFGHLEPIAQEIISRNFYEKTKDEISEIIRFQTELHELRHAENDIMLLNQRIAKLNNEIGIRTDLRMFEEFLSELTTLALTPQGTYFKLLDILEGCSTPVLVNKIPNGPSGLFILNQLAGQFEFDLESLKDMQSHESAIEIAKMIFNQKTEAEIAQAAKNIYYDLMKNIGKEKIDSGAIGVALATYETNTNEGYTADFVISSESNLSDAQKHQIAEELLKKCKSKHIKNYDVSGTISDTLEVHIDISEVLKSHGIGYTSFEAEAILEIAKDLLIYDPADVLDAPKKSEQSLSDTSISNDSNQEIQDLEIKIIKLTARKKGLEKWKEKINNGTFEDYAVIGDIHGDYEKLIIMIKDLENKGIKKFIFLGDYIDRGPQSYEALNYIMSLKGRSDLEVVTLLGNHEMFLLNMFRKDDVDSAYASFLGWLANYGEGFLLNENMVHMLSEDEREMLEELQKVPYQFHYDYLLIDKKNITDGLFEKITDFQKKAPLHISLFKFAQWMRKNLDVYHSLSDERHTFIHGGFEINQMGESFFKYQGLRENKALEKLQKDFKSDENYLTAYDALSDSKRSVLWVRDGWRDMIDQDNVFNFLNDFEFNLVFFGHSVQPELFNVGNKVFGIDLALSRGFHEKTGGGNFVVSKDGLKLNSFKKGLDYNVSEYKKDDFSESEVLSKDKLIDQINEDIALLDEFIVGCNVQLKEYRAEPIPVDEIVPLDLANMSEQDIIDVNVESLNLENMNNPFINLFVDDRGCIIENSDSNPELEGFNSISLTVFPTESLYPGVIDIYAFVRNVELKETSEQWKKTLFNSLRIYNGELASNDPNLEENLQSLQNGDAFISSISGTKRIIVSRENLSFKLQVEDKDGKNRKEATVPIHMLKENLIQGIAYVKKSSSENNLNGNISKGYSEKEIGLFLKDVYKSEDFQKMNLIKFIHLFKQNVKVF